MASYGAVTVNDSSHFCRFCDEHRRLVKAHLVPESFYEFPRGSSGGRIISSEEEFSKRAPIGVYDTEILYERCEKGFGRYDTYAHRLLIRDRASAKEASQRGEILIYVYESCNYRGLLDGCRERVYATRL